MINVHLEVSAPLATMDTLQLTAAICASLGTVPDLHVHRIDVEESDA